MEYTVDEIRNFTSSSAVNCLISSTVYSIVLLPFSVGYIHLLIGVFAVRCDNGIVVAEHRLRVTVK